MHNAVCGAKLSSILISHVGRLEQLCPFALVIFLLAAIYSGQDWSVLGVACQAEDAALGSGMTDLTLVRCVRFNDKVRHHYVGLAV